MNIPVIGRFDFNVESSLQSLRFKDGVEIYQKNIKPIQDGFLEGKLKIVFVFDVNTPILNTKGEKTLLSEFFIGALEPLLVAVRDKRNRREDIDLNKRSIRDVSIGNDSASDILQYAFGNALDVYDDMNKWVSNQILIGIRDNNGAINLVELDENEMMLPLHDEDVENLASHFSDKFYKAFDAMYASNLTVSRSFEDRTSNPRNILS